MRFALCCLFLICCLCLPGRAQAARPLEIISALPEGRVTNLTQVVARFSEAMRPLGVMDQDASSAPLRLRVPGGVLPPGNFRWLDPETLAYLFDTPVAVPLRLEAEVPAGTRALSGAALEHSKRWQISTPPLAFSLEDHEPLPPKGAVVRLRANYELDLQSLRDKISLSTPEKQLRLKVSGGEERIGSRQGRQGIWEYTLAVLDTLPRDQEVRLVLAPGVAARGGHVPAAGAEFTLRTYGPLRLKDWPGKDEAQPVDGLLWFSFTNPVHFKDFLAGLRLEPQPALNLDPDAAQEFESQERTDTSFAVPYRLAPRTSYTFSFAPTFRDAYGEPLAERAPISFTTGDYAPFFYVPGGQLLERALGGFVPLAVRNISPLKVTLRYLPWGKDAFALLTDGNESSASRKKLWRSLREGKLAGQKQISQRLDFSGRENSNILELLDIPRLLGVSGPEALQGLVDIEISLPREAQDDQGRKRRRWYRDSYDTLAWLSNLGLTMRLGRGSGLAWVTSLESGAPVPDASLFLLNSAGKVLWEGRSDGEGLASLPGLEELAAQLGSDPEAEPLLLARKGKDSAVLYGPSARLNGPYGDFLRRPKKETLWRVHGLAQLPLYQPGDEVRFVVYAKQLANTAPAGQDELGGWLALADAELEIAIVDPWGKKVYAGTHHSNVYGSVEGSFRLAPEASLGAYQMRVKHPGFVQEAYCSPFTVASFRPPDFKVDLTVPPSGPVPLPGETLPHVGLEAGYFSGAPLSGGKAQLEVSRDETWFGPERLRGFAVGNRIPFDAPGGPVRVASLEAVPDSRGAASFSLPGIAVPPGRPATIECLATVTDASGLTTQGTGSFILHPSAWYVGLKTAWFAPLNKQVPLSLKVATWDNQPLEDVVVTVTAVRHSNAAGKEEERAVWENAWTVGAPEGEERFIKFTASGRYTLVASVKDPQGRENISKTEVFVPGPGAEWISGVPGGPLELRADKESYRAGETARVIINNPFAGEPARALVTLERGRVRSARTLELKDQATIIELPLETADAPYVFATVTAIKGRTSPPPDWKTVDPWREETRDVGAPQVRFGTLVLPVEEASRGLEVTLEADAEEYRPGQTVRLDLLVTDRHKKPRKAQVTLLAVDERILRAAGEATDYDPAASFGPLYSLGVRGADGRRALMPLSVPLMKELERPMQAMARGALYDAAPALKANGAAESASASASPALRHNFNPMAYWLAQGESNIDGKLSVSFKLPDTLTGYRIVAVAADAADAFAVRSESITVNKPLQLISALPRFVVEGDRLEARIVAQNTGSQPGTATVVATLTGGTLEENESERRIALQPGGSGTVAFPILAGKPGNLVLRVSGRLGEETDQAEFIVPVLPHLPLTAVAAAGLLDQGERYNLPLALPERLDSRSSLSVTLAPSPAAGVAPAMGQLLEYPWDCLEQRMSRAWARALRLERGPLLGLTPDPEDREAVRSAMSRAATFQNPDGGFSLWPGLGASNFYLSCYVLLVDRQVRKVDQGPGQTRAMGLDEDVARRAYRYLAARLEREEQHASYAECEALALWLLAGHAPKSALKLYPILWERIAGDALNPMGWAALLLAAAELPQLPGGEEYRAAALKGLERNARVTPTQLHFAAIHEAGSWVTMGSSLRDNGMVLAALALAHPDYPRLEALAHWVGQGLGEKQVLSTQEAAFGLWGLTEYLTGLSGSGNVRIKASWGAEKNLIKSFAKLTKAPYIWTLSAGELAAAGTEAKLSLSAEQGKPYWTARLLYGSPDLPVEAENAGFTLGRSWITPGPWKMGDIIDVSLTLTVPATRRHVVLFDPFPAGLEPLFASRADLAGQRRQYPWQWQEERQDGLLLYAERIEPGTYTYTYRLRAAAPGVFAQRPSRVEEMYTPEVFGRTGADEVTVKE